MLTSGLRWALSCLLLLGCQGAFSAPSLEVVATLEVAPGNITLTPDGRIVFSLHQFFEPEQPVAEWRDGSLGPFPPTDSAAPGASTLRLDSVLGIQSDRDGVVWMLDNGMRSGVVPRLVAWDTRRGRLHREIALGAPLTTENAFVNDLAVDESRNVVFIADPAGGEDAALMVVDLTDSRGRRLLQGHESVVPEDLDLVIDGEPVQIRQPDGSLVRPRVGVNPIALDGERQWLYYGPMHGRSLYRVRVADLLDEGLSPEELAARVQRYSAKPICDGISIDRDGNIYVTDVANNAIGVIDHTRRYRILVQDPRLSWPDALSFGPDQRLYTVSNQLHRSAVLHGGEQTARPPYYVFSFRPLAEGFPGR